MSDREGGNCSRAREPHFYPTLSVITRLEIATGYHFAGSAGRALYMGEQTRCGLEENMAIKRGN
jgi:hypothetical protein